MSDFKDKLGVVKTTLIGDGEDNGLSLEDRLEKERIKNIEKDLAFSEMSKTPVDEKFMQADRELENIAIGSVEMFDKFKNKNNAVLLCAMVSAGSIFAANHLDRGWNIGVFEALYPRSRKYIMKKTMNVENTLSFDDMMDLYVKDAFANTLVQEILEQHRTAFEVDVVAARAAQKVSALARNTKMHEKFSKVSEIISTKLDDMEDTSSSPTVKNSTTHVDDLIREVEDNNNSLSDILKTIQNGRNGVNGRKNF